MRSSKKLQVFVSSTFIDLIEERQAAVQAILNAGHIPAGMELFKSGDDSQWNIIKNWIEESDVYMLMIGGRYGSIEPDSGKSYTQLEYEYAIQLNKPFFAIIIKDEWTIKKAKKKGVKIEDFTEVNNRQKLNDFKAIAMSKMVKFAEDLKDIKLGIGDSLNEISKRDSLIGWVRESSTDFSKISEEMALLSKENRVLKEKLADTDTVEKINGIEIHKFAEYLRDQETSLYKQQILKLKKEFLPQFFASIELNYLDSEISELCEIHKDDLKTFFLKNIDLEFFKNKLKYITNRFGMDWGNFLQFFYFLNKDELGFRDFYYMGDYKDLEKFNLFSKTQPSSMNLVEYIYLNEQGIKLLLFLENYENQFLLKSKEVDKNKLKSLIINTKLYN